MAQTVAPLILKELDAARVMGLSARTLQRLRVDGGGPPFVMLTERRVGYAVDALRVWAEERTVCSTSAATARHP